jgi:hypothetical protein
MTLGYGARSCRFNTLDDLSFGCGRLRSRRRLGHSRWVQRRKTAGLARPCGPTACRRDSPRHKQVVLDPERRLNGLGRTELASRPWTGAFAMRPKPWALPACLMPAPCAPDARTGPDDADRIVTDGRVDSDKCCARPKRLIGMAGSLDSARTLAAQRTLIADRGTDLKASPLPPLGAREVVGVAPANPCAC